MHLVGENLNFITYSRIGLSSTHIILHYADFMKLFFLVLSDLNQAVPNHLADESQTR